jgi:uncharacterized damage-inducible protein DinB
MQLKQTAESILKQIMELTNQLSDADYTAELNLLGGNTIGKHVRHITEFFDLLTKRPAAGVINYDLRKHGEELEKDRIAMLQKIEQIITRVDDLNLEEAVILEVSYAANETNTVQIESGLARELAYNIEHAIHHMAIIKMAIRTVFPAVQLAGNFGVAYSTVRFQARTGQK